MASLSPRFAFCVQASALCLGALVAAATPAAAAHSAPVPTTQGLSVTALNVQYFGIGGKLEGTPADETRVDSLRAFFTAEHLWADVMVFEEIVDVALLETSVLGADYHCGSYDNPDPKHQHVVICAGPGLNLEKASDDDNFALESVALGVERYRPAVHGLITNKKGQTLVHVMGLHLKAMPECGALRLQQADLIHDYLAHRADAAPMLILGDTNTYGDDAATIGAKWADTGLVEVNDPAPYTYRGGRYKDKFDRAWLTAAQAKGAVIRVAGPCNDADASPADIARYNETVSDHCAIHFDIPAR